MINWAKKKFTQQKSSGKYPEPPPLVPKAPKPVVQPPMITSTTDWLYQNTSTPARDRGSVVSIFAHDEFTHIAGSRDHLMSLYGDYVDRFGNSSLHRIKPVKIPRSPDLEMTRAQAIGMLFSLSSERNPARYYVELEAAKKFLEEAFCLGKFHVQEFIESKGREVDPLFNKTMWYVAQLIAKSRGANAHTKDINLPPDLYQNIIRELEGVQSPRFAKLDDLLSTWSGKSQPPPKDELAFDQHESEQMMRRYEVGGRRLPRPGVPLRKQSDYPDPYASSLSATAHPLPGKALSPEERRYWEQIHRLAQVHSASPGRSAPVKTFLL